MASTSTHPLSSWVLWGSSQRQRPDLGGGEGSMQGDRLGPLWVERPVRRARLSQPFTVAGDSRPCQARPRGGHQPSRAPPAGECDQLTREGAGRK